MELSLIGAIEQEITWILEIAIGLSLIVALGFGLKHFLKYVRRRFLSLSPEWREKIDYIVLKPIKYFLWVLGVLYAVDIVARKLHFTVLAGHIVPLRNIALTLAIAWLVLRWRNAFQQSFYAKSSKGILGVEMGIIHAMGRIFGVIVFLIAALVILQILGLNVMPLIAFGGVGAAAIGFAAKDMISNFFGGFMLYINRPFLVGDYIILPEKSVDGLVEDIGWYLTSIRNKDKQPVYIPNSLFLSAFVSNASRMSHRHIRELISLRYEDISKLKGITEEIRVLIAKHPAIDKNLPILVYFEGYKDFSVDILIDTYCFAMRDDDFFAMKQEIFLGIEKILTEHQAAMPLPTQVNIMKQS